MKKTLLSISVPLILLGDVYTFDCTFPIFSSEKSFAEKDMMHIVYKYDSFSNKAYMEGNNGISPVELIVKKGTLVTFLEITDAGNITTTSIHPSTKKAVHSRHMKIVKSLATSQYYGSCTESIKRADTAKTSKKIYIPPQIRATVSTRLKLKEKLEKLKPIERKVILGVLDGTTTSDEALSRMSKEGMTVYLQTMLMVGEELNKMIMTKDRKK